MFGFVLKLVFVVGLVVLAKFLRNKRNEFAAEPEEGSRRSREDREKSWVMVIPYRLIMSALWFLILSFVLWAVIGTSVVWVPAGSIATLKRVYLASSLPPGRIVALSGQLGPQARVLTAGFHFETGITLINEVGYEPVLSIPSGKCALMSARDGLPNQHGSAFAEPWTDSLKQSMANDATFFLTEGKGQRGPQTSVLGPGSYTINPFLWDQPHIIDATRVEQGTVGVVKSSVHAAVDFGSFKRPAPESTQQLKVLNGDRLPRGSAGALLVPVGAIGVWEEPLPNGLYYINTEAYRITMVPTVAQVYEYKGGYKRRTVEISVDAKGAIAERVSEAEIQSTPNMADTAIFTKPEGWDVPQELRVLVQVRPDMAPFVVASLGLTQQNSSQVIEDRVVTPIIRSTVRDVLGGAQISFRYLKAVLDREGRPVIDTLTSEPLTVMASEFRATKVMDLLENRTSLEQAIEDRSKPEALKEGITINEVRLSESAIPAELLIARKREQLAQQLTKAWSQEEQAQKQRQQTENARSQADQQDTLVKAEIAAKAAKETANARTIEGEGEQKYLTAIAAGQKAQAEILGKDTTARLQMFQQLLKVVSDLAREKPEVIIQGLQSVNKFVPYVSVSGGSGGLEGAAAVFGTLIGPAASTTGTLVMK